MSSRKKVIFTGSILILVVILSMIYYFLPKIEINLHGEENITIAYGEVYNEQGADVYLKSGLRKEKLKTEIKGKVNTFKIGKYIISYQAKNKFLEKEIIRIVNVIDNIKPEIIINSDIIGCKNNNLIDFNAEAIDNYDGNITEKIKYQVENEELKIIVSDSSNNKTELTKKIKYIDNEKPIITLKGNKYIYLEVGEEYDEYGATANDSCDGDLTDKIEIKNSINTSIPGEYKISYSVSDNNENKTTIYRNIIVSEKDENINYEIQNSATIYLTFDDGPGAYTEKILNILDEYEIKATFFVTGQFSNYQYLIQEEYKRGHGVGIHTYTHKWSIYESVESYLEDFNKIENIIYNETGIHTKIFRFPGGSSNTVSRQYSKGIMSTLAKTMEEKGYIYFDWTFDSGDTSKKDNSKSAIIKNIKSNLKGDGNYVILMHDIKKNTMEALPEIIEYALSKGYKFDKLTETSPTEHFHIVN